MQVTSMLARGAEKVFASDVGSIDDNSPRTFPDTVSGWWVLFARWWPVSFEVQREMKQMTQMLRSGAMPRACHP